MEKEASERFAFRAKQVEESLRDRLHAYSLALQGGAALFAASREVSRAEWRAYVGALNLYHNYPGIQAMGYARHLPGDQAEATVRQVRAEGYQDYRIWPAGPRAVYGAIVYLEPFSGSNLRAFGYDMYSEPVRRAAMEQARDTSRPSLSGKVSLVQEGSRTPQPGFLIYVPVYRNDLPTETIAQRRAALAGWVYAAFRMSDFMAGLLGTGPILSHDVDLEVFDGEGIDSASLMWDYDNSERWRHNRPSELGIHTTLLAGGHFWTLHLAATPAFSVGAYDREPRLALLIGLIGSLLVFALIRAMASTRARALDLARDMTASLAASEERHRQMFTNNQAVKLLIDPSDMHIVDANPAAAAYYGYPLDHLLTLKVTDINTLPPEAIAREMELARQEKRHHFNFRHRLAGGEVRDVEVFSGPIRDGERTLLYSIVHDVTERNRAQAEQRAILQSALIGIAHVRDRRWIWANAGMEEMFGYPLNELRGQPTQQLYASVADFERVGREAYPVLAKGEPYLIELPMRRRDGSTFWCRLSGRLIDIQQPELGSIWTLNDIDATVQANAQLVALNNQLRELSLHDPLTGLYNRRHLEEALTRDLRIAERKGRQLALIMLDIDHFKRFNDQFGHDAGDHVLREIAALLARQVRDTDTACRFGGEEFLILMPESDPATAMRRAEAIRESAQSLLLDFLGQPLGRITLSLGVAVYPDHAGDGQTLVASADAALYRAKQGGRNRVEPAAEPTSP